MLQNWNHEEYEKLNILLEKNAISRIKNYPYKKRSNASFDPYFHSDLYIAKTIEIPNCAYYNNEGMYIEANLKWSTGSAIYIQLDRPTRLPIEAKPCFDFNFYRTVSRFRYNMMGIKFSDNIGLDYNERL